MRKLSYVPAPLRVSTADGRQGDFEAVAFQAFSVARNPTRSSSSTLDCNISDDIRVAEAELRSAHHIVLHDASRSWLWLFRAATADHVGQPPLDPPSLDDFCLNSGLHTVSSDLQD
jgi:mediator of RNA polymerase II transcription subunit 13